MRVAVVGGTGNVGTALLRRLGREPHVDVVGVARRMPQEVEPYAGVRWVLTDVSDSSSRPALEDAFAGVDAVVHLAWLLQPSHDEGLMLRTNVHGTRRVVEAAVAAGVAHLVVSSSVGAYAPVPRDTSSGEVPRDETWPTTGNAGSGYSRQKAVVEAYLDEVQAAHPDLVVSRLRPGLVFQGDAGSEIGRYFLGRVPPASILGLLPVLPLPPSLRFQAVHSDDLADAFWRVLDQRAPGAVNVAAEPVLRAPDVAAAFGARLVPVPFAALRLAAGLTWRLRLQPTSAGWVNLGEGVPVMDTSRARDELGWRPRYTARDALAELADGMVRGRGHASPPLHPRGAWRG